MRANAVSRLFYRDSSFKAISFYFIQIFFIYQWLRSAGYQSWNFISRMESEKWKISPLISMVKIFTFHPIKFHVWYPECLLCNCWRFSSRWLNYAFRLREMIQFQQRIIKWLQNCCVLLNAANGMWETSTRHLSLMTSLFQYGRGD